VKTTLNTAFLALFLGSFIPVAAAQQVQSMKLLTAQVGWAQFGQHLYWTTDDGAHWKMIDPHTSSKLGIVSVFFLDTNIGWVLLSGGDEKAAEPEFELASTTDAGSSWHVAPVKINNLDPNSTTLDGRGTIYFVDGEHGGMNLWVVSSAAFRGGLLLMTEDGGRTWRWAPGGSGAGTGTLYFTTPTDGWTAGGPVGQLYVTHDGAKSWQEVTLKAPGAVIAKYTPTYDVPTFTDPKHGFLPVTYSGPDGSEAVLVLFSSDDGGLTWKTDRVLPNRGDFSVGEKIPATVADSVLLAAPNSSGGTIPLTAAPPGTKPSTTIAKVSTGGVVISQLSFVDASRGWASTSQGLFSTQDGGVTWTDITPGKLPGTGQPTHSTIGRPPRRSKERPGAQAAETPASPAVDTHLGFDRCGIPSEAKMLTWWQYSPFFNVGIYIGGASVSSSCLANSGWISDVEKYGWGMIPLWSGPQAPCACRPGYVGCSPFPHVFSWDPATASTQGAEEADSATVTET
jgi:photosystem II stability/assembly factor-like uncharacterized protein